MHRYLFLTSASAIACLAAAADPLLQQARATSDTEGPVYAYEMDYFDGEVRATGKVDPGAPEGERITIYSPDESEWSDDFRKAIESIDAEVDGDIFCDDFATQIPDDARRTRETDDAVYYAFTPQADEDTDDMQRKVFKKIEASAAVAKSDGQILSFNMALPKPFKPALVAKINTFRMDVSCARAPDGRTYLETLDLNVSGSAMMQSFDQTISRQITKLLEPVSMP